MYGLLLARTHILKRLIGDVLVLVVSAFPAAFVT